MTDELARFSVIVPTIGRPTLANTLQSCDSILVDEILVSPDGRQAHAAAEEILTETALSFVDVCLLDPVDESRMNQVGHPQRNRAMLMASAPWLAFLDDDDVFVQGAFPLILLGLKDYVPHLFRVRHIGGNEAGKTIWEEPELREGDCCTPGFVVPNRALGWWDGKRAGDFRFMAETCAMQGGPVFVDTVIAEVRP